LTFSLNFRWAASTEGASLLQAVQPGAQNHKAKGFSCATDSKLNESPLIVVNCSSAANDVAGIDSSGKTEVSGASELAVTLEVSGETDEFEPQAPRNRVTVHRATTRENGFMKETVLRPAD
jgi:hypothetical protein